MYMYYTDSSEKACFEGLSVKRINNTKLVLKSHIGDRYRFKIKDKCFIQIIISVEDFIKERKVLQLWCKFDITIIENLNMVVATYAPKYCHVDASKHLKKFVLQSVHIMMAIFYYGEKY